jgi:hypothetical protein
MELIDITPEDSAVPVYMELLTEEEQVERDAEATRMAEEQAQLHASMVSKVEAFANGS